MTDVLVSPTTPLQDGPRRHAQRIAWSYQRPHVGVKLLLVGLYVVLLLTTHTFGQLLLDADVLLLASMLCVLPLRTLYLPIAAGLAIEACLLAPVGTVPAWLIPVCGLMCMGQVFALFSATTPVQEVLFIFSVPALRLPVVSVLVYMLTTTLAVLPTIQRDLRVCIDVAVLRAGRRRTLVLPTTWVAIVLDLLIRTVLRSQQLADSVADRNFSLSRGLTPLPQQQFGLFDVLLGLLLAVPGVVIYRMML